jgi:hypothetical protein
MSTHDQSLHQLVGNPICEKGVDAVKLTAKGIFTPCSLANSIALFGLPSIFTHLVSSLT